MGIRLHYRIVFELIYGLCNLSLHYRIGFRINYVIISASMVFLGFGEGVKSARGETAILGRG